jgi:hypothetical protein
VGGVWLLALGFRKSTLTFKTYTRKRQTWIMGSAMYAAKDCRSWRMNSYKITAQYKKSSVVIEIVKRDDVWSYGFDILFKDSGLYHGHSFAPLLKWNSFKTEFECKKAAVKYILETSHTLGESERKISRKLYSILSAKFLPGVDENAIDKTIRALEQFNNKAGVCRCEN